MPGYEHWIWMAICVVFFAMGFRFGCGFASRQFERMTDRALFKARRRGKLHPDEEPN